MNEWIRRRADDLLGVRKTPKLGASRRPSVVLKAQEETTSQVSGNVNELVMTANQLARTETKKPPAPNTH